MPASPDDFAARLQARMAELPLTMRRIAQYFDQNRAEVMSRSANELARAIGTSDASIIRTAKALGYAGLPELKRSLADLMAEATPAEGFSRTLRSADADARKAITQAMALQQRQLAELASEAANAALMQAAAILDRAERIVLFGIGPTAHLVGYGAHLMSRHGRRTHLLDAAGSGLADQLLALRQGDAILALSYGRPYPEIETVIAEAIALSAPLVLVTDNSAGRLASQADLVVRVPRGETKGMALHGSTLIWIEALVIALSVLQNSPATHSLDRLTRLRNALAGKS